MLPRFLSKPTWCPKSTIATACCMASQINYWIVFSEFRTMLLGWSSGCTNSAISHQHCPHYTGSCQSPNRFQDRIAGLQNPKWSNPSLYRRSPAVVWSTLEAALGWQATSFTAALSFEILWWPCGLLCNPVVWNKIPHSVKTAKTVDSFKVKLGTHLYSVSFA